MKSKPISLAFALLALLLAVGTAVHFQTRGRESGESGGAVENPTVGGNEVTDGRKEPSAFKTRVRTTPSLITDLDEAELLLVQSDIDPSNVTAQTQYRLQAVVRRINPSLLGSLLARIDASLDDYFRAMAEPPSAIATGQPHYLETARGERDAKMALSRESLVHEWAIHRLEEALDYAVGAARPRDRETFAIAALSTRVPDAPLDAIARVAELPDPGLRDPVRQEVYRAWLVADPMSAMSWAGDWPDADQREDYVEMGSAVIAKTDPALALRAVAGIPSGDERRKALAGIATSWSLQDPQSMATYLRNDPHSNPADNEAMVGALVYNWYQRDSQAALNWIAGLPEGPTRAEADRFLTQVMKKELPVAR